MLEKDQNQRPEIEEIIQTDVFQAKARLYGIELPPTLMKASIDTKSQISQNNEKKGFP